MWNGFCGLWIATDVHRKSFTRQHSICMMPSQTTKLTMSLGPRVLQEMHPPLHCRGHFYRDEVHVSLTWPSCVYVFALAPRHIHHRNIPSSVYCRVYCHCSPSLCSSGALPHHSLYGSWTSDPSHHFWSFSHSCPHCLACDSCACDFWCFLCYEVSFHQIDFHCALHLCSHCHCHCHSDDHDDHSCAHLQAYMPPHLHPHHHCVPGC
mmetsp:Transcript_10390/g.12166  ORF Transcript_10390/g.12166 Transcript_10390/m.12166 type:complete len:207 (-) Transcript_10390:533-1153(-)